MNFSVDIIFPPCSVAYSITYATAKSQSYGTSGSATFGCNVSFVFVYFASLPFDFAIDKAE
ncbi:MAG: hypothetical protein NC132_05055 [Corallococcus sp.]|nr:hypothetical protein [Corallococcus sp.]